jgi:uncharacterized protein (DUF1800 family)
MPSLLPKKRVAANTTIHYDKHKQNKAMQYTVDADNLFDATNEKFTAIIRGRALAWRRIGFGWNQTCYNPCKAAQKDFVEALNMAFC